MIALDTLSSRHLPRVEASIRSRSPIQLASLYQCVTLTSEAALIPYRQNPETPWEHAYPLRSCIVGSRSSSTSSRKLIFSPRRLEIIGPGPVLDHQTYSIWMRTSAGSKRWCTLIPQVGESGPELIDIGISRTISLGRRDGSQPTQQLVVRMPLHGR